MSRVPHLVRKSTAILVDVDPEYVWAQLRDDLPGVPYAGCVSWTGGSCEPHESYLEALFRELKEELEFTANPGNVSELGHYSKRTIIPDDIDNAELMGYVYHEFSERHLENHFPCSSYDGQRAYRTNEGRLFKVRPAALLHGSYRLTRITNRMLEDWLIRTFDEC